MKYLLTLILEHKTGTLHDVKHEIRTAHTIVNSENPEDLVTSFDNFMKNSVNELRSKHNQDFRPVSHSIIKL